MKVNVTEGDLALGVQVIVEKHGAKARYALQLLQTRGYDRCGYGIL